MVRVRTLRASSAASGLVASGLVFAPAAEAHPQPPVGSCPPGWQMLNVSHNHELHARFDRNGDKWICAKALPGRSQGHGNGPGARTVYKDNNQPLG